MSSSELSTKLSGLCAFCNNGKHKTTPFSFSALINDFFYMSKTLYAYTTAVLFVKKNQTQIRAVCAFEILFWIRFTVRQVHSLQCCDFSNVFNRQINHISYQNSKSSVVRVIWNFRIVFFCGVKLNWLMAADMFF